jgi:hypothetical protein
MKHFKHPATIIAAIALFAALSGGAGAAMTTLISGSQIKDGSIPEKKLESSAIKALQVTGVGHSVSYGTGGCAVNTTNSAKFCGTPVTVTFDKKTAVVVTGSVDLASTNGVGMHAQFGVCYAKHGSSTLTPSSFVYPDFTAPTDSWFAQAVTGAVGGLKGTYDVGLCLEEETGNTENGDYSMTALTTETNKGVQQLGPNPSGPSRRNPA